jgi:hypothetical protein
MTYQSANDNVELLVEGLVVVLDHAVVRDHTSSRNPTVDEFGGGFGLQEQKKVQCHPQFQFLT